ncbi:protein phosphatase 2C domain-containing protein, partial [Planctomycetota bacterium]|nr:protein phosphatase 2C domain-containing protein [Planctomycetota bacterium]
MVDNPAIPVWTIGAWQPGIGDSSIGFQHQSEGLPNQDAYCLEQYDSISATLCVIADGHSGESALRSQVGSRLAVESFRRVVEKDVIPIFRSGNVDAGQLEELWTKVEKRVEKLWIEECLKHLLENPFSEKENKIRLGQIELVKRPVSAYSTTLSGALLTQDFGLFLHLGDAELILANTDGVTESVSRSSVVPEESLGSANHLPFISRVLTGQDWHSKQLVFLATDGVGDAFSNKEAVHEHVVDYLNKWRDKGSPKKLSILTRDHCLRFSGEGGSGGDATLLIVKRFEKEDILSRVEFESAWIEFERNKINLLAEVHHSADQLKQKLKLFSDKMIQDSNSAKTDLDQTGKRNRDEIIRIGDEHFNKITKRAGDVLAYFDEQGSKLDKNEKEIENLSRRVRLLSVVLIVIVLFLVLS